MERPSLHATIPPLRERRWTPEAQRQILQHELIDMAFYRHLCPPEVSSADECGRAAASSTLLELLEKEFDQLLLRRPTGLAEDGETDAVCCLRFPPMRARYRYLIAKVASRYHLQTHSFDEEERRFTVVYKHARGATAPVLRLGDFRHARAYFSPPPRPPRVDHGAKRSKFVSREADVYDLEAEELPAVHDFSPWGLACEKAMGGVSASAHDEGEAEEGGYECEIAGCHAHILEISRPEPAPISLSQLASAAPEASAARALPDGGLLVFRSEVEASTFILRHSPLTAGVAPRGDPSGLQRITMHVAIAAAEPAAEPAPDGDGGTTDAGATEKVAVVCSARPLSALQRRTLVLGGGGGRATNRALQSALRGAGVGGRRLTPAGGRGRGGSES